MHLQARFACGGPHLAAPSLHPLFKERPSRADTIMTGNRVFCLARTLAVERMSLIPLDADTHLPLCSLLACRTALDRCSLCFHCLVHTAL